MNKQLLLALMLVLPTLSQAQFVPQKFGKITPEEIDLKVYSKDSSAAAVVLFDKGDFYYSFDNNSSDFKVSFTEHKRIKILKKEGEEYATVKIPMYGRSESKEVINSFKAYTYNVSDGKMEKVKLDKSLVYKERVNDFLSINKFTFPSVKEGSIIEYEIEITSGYDTNVNDWYFQSSIPVAWSGYDVSIPEYYVFNRQTKGYNSFAESSRSQESKSINLGGTNSILYTDNKDHFVMKDIPAFKKEPFMDCANNYLSMVTYELSSLQFPGALYKNFNTSWEKISEDILKDSDFGGQIRTRGFFKDDLAAAIKNDTTQLSKINSIFKLVKSKVKWNDVNTYWCKGGIKKAYKDGIGNCAEINLLLVAMLKEAGLTAYPVILSTRENGLMDFGHPSSSKANYVVAVVEANNKPLFLDATRKYNQIGVLPFCCLNGKGRIVEPDKFEWIVLNPENKPSKKNYYTEISIADDGTVSGKMQLSYLQNEANDKRASLFAKKEEDFKKDIQTSIGDCTIDSLAIDNLKENLEAPLYMRFQYSIPNKASFTGKNIFINPFIWGKVTENTFKLEKRTYPINYGYPFQTRHTILITIPKGYTIDELPQNLAIGTSDKSAVVIVSYAVNDNSITINYVFNINKPLFLPTEYDEIKELYNKIVEKHAEMISFKKV
jgi:Transglutaminase-like superfamily.